jgi:choline-sulfatase
VSCGRLRTFLCCAFLLAAAVPRAAGAQRAPNIILISVDTLRADRLPAYGYSAIRTPNIDRLRSDSVLFLRAWSHAPLTAPAHASMLTGLLPAEHGIRDNTGHSLADKMTIPQRLQRRGYATGAFVSTKVLARSTGLDRGFAVYDDAFQAAQRAGDVTVGSAIQWMNQQRGPFFLFVHLYEPHAPYESSPGIADPYDAEVVRSDALAGRLVDAIRAKGLYQEALIVFTSDHGEGLGDHGEKEHGVLLYRETLQVPLLVKLPRSRLGGKRAGGDVQLIDIAPTILAVAGVTGVTLPGTSLALLANMVRKRPIFAETLYPRNQLGWQDLRSVIDDGLHVIDGAAVETYDLVADPREQRDITDGHRRRVHPLLRALRAAERTSPSPVRRQRPENAEALESLGYLGAGGDDALIGQHLPDPRSRIHIVEESLRLTAYLRKQQYTQALKIADAILERYPDYFEVWDRKAIALLGLGRKKEAEDAARQALQHAPRK